MSEATSAHHAKRREGQEDSLEFLVLPNAFVTVCNTVAYTHHAESSIAISRGRTSSSGTSGKSWFWIGDWRKPSRLIAVNRCTFTVTVDPEESIAPDLTRHGQALGTPMYMAPEQAASTNDQVDERSDVYGSAPC